MGPGGLTHGNPIPEAHAPNPFVYLGYTNGTEESSWDASSCRGVRVCACRMIGHIGLWRALNSLQYRLHGPRGNWNWQAWQLLELLYCKCSTLLQDLQARLTILFFSQRCLCKVAAAHRVPQNPICSKSLLRAALLFTSPIRPIINWKIAKVSRRMFDESTLPGMVLGHSRHRGLGQNSEDLNKQCNRQTFTYESITSPCQTLKTHVLISSISRSHDSHMFLQTDAQLLKLNLWLLGRPTVFCVRPRGPESKGWGVNWTWGASPQL